MPKLVFIVTEDWFFVSHFLPMLGAARQAGFDPVVVTRVRDHADSIRNNGARVISFEADRRSLNPLALVKSVWRLARILRRERPAIVHCIALRSILVGGAAATMSGVRARVFAVTGGGFLTARTDRPGRCAARTVTFVIRRMLAGSKAQFLFENRDDPVSFGLEPETNRVTIVGGAGVDPAFYSVPPGPVGKPLRVALVSRLLWSKGVDLLVEAVTQARLGGTEIELSLFGAPDAANPRSIPLETLEEWSTRDGIRWYGPTQDVRSVWMAHDVACLPSRGGEGLPRTLLEAASCGRAIVTTCVPGCREFVRDGIDGIVVPPGDVPALRDALIRLAGDEVLVLEMQRHARARIEDGYTESAVSSKVEAMYRRMAITAGQALPHRPQSP